MSRPAPNFKAFDVLRWLVVCKENNPETSQ